MRWTVVSLVAALVLSLVPAHRAAAQQGAYRRMTGAINRNIPIEVFLTIRGDGRVSGSYLYARIGIPLELSGSLDAKGALVMTERDPATGRETGTFQGTLLSGEASGTWTSGDGRKSFAFSLAEERSAGTPLSVLELSERRRLDPDKSEGPFASVDFCLLVPRSGDRVASAMQEELFEAKPPEMWAEIRAEEFFAYYEDEAKPVYVKYPTAASLNWSRGATDRVLFDGGTWLCVQRSFWEYTGGAHDSAWDTSYVFDLSTGRRLLLEDLVPPESRKELGRVLTASLRLAEGLKAGQKLSESGYFADSVEAPINFSLTPSGVLFAFNPYDVAPWARGRVRVFVPWKDLTGLLKFQPTF
jgi:hypothetical protein